MRLAKRIGHVGFRDRHAGGPPAGAGAAAATGVGNPSRLQDCRHLRRRVRGRHPYFYSTYEDAPDSSRRTKPRVAREKALVIGSGPIRIGQGIEFDYSAVHAAWALQEEGIAAIIANSNPETVSTDFDTSDRLYFEPLDDEAVRDLLENEGGQRARAVDPSCSSAARRRSTSPGRWRAPTTPSSAPAPRAIDIAEDRRRFEALLQNLGIPQPPGAGVTTLDEALSTAQLIGYPVLVRPQLRPRRPGDGDRPEPARPRALCRGSRRDRRRQARAHRQVPRGHRGRGRRHLRRRGHPDPRRHEAHRARRRPLGRLDGRIPGAGSDADTRSKRWPTTRSGWRVAPRCARPDERPVRDHATRGVDRE